MTTAGVQVPQQKKMNKKCAVDTARPEGQKQA